MALARGTVLVATMVLLFVVLHCEVAHAKTWTVGDGFGWTLAINEEVWPRGKTFYAGDILVFNYDYQEGNVVVVNKKGYDTCTVNEKARVYESGHDRIQLAFGQNYFISSYQEGECAGGLKMAIYAKARPPLQ
ncbi:Cu_bind_like domain-containing protein [Cephalotus follicularis]|uniref:Basic blue protein n=1 Tax=Cephalotus follicularis TaxID=3775 RepID=A0A1Q3BH97_CEPFO|nr:Cu_bind_like domain-containing protein [Cephalotus follicularis]